MKAISLAIAASAAAVIASSASASNWQLTYHGYGLAKGVKIAYDNNKSWNGAAASSFANITAGQHLFSGLGNNFKTYCVQLFEGLPAVGSSAEWCPADLVDVPDAPPAPGPMGAMVATLVQDFYARFHAAVQDSNNSTQTAAFQVVLWELTHENFTAPDAASALAQIDLGLGAFQLSGASADVLNAANSMIADLGDGGFKSLGGNLFGLTNPQYQDHLVVVPIPAPALLAGLGLIGVAALRRRQK